MTETAETAPHAKHHSNIVAPTRAHTRTDRQTHWEPQKQEQRHKKSG